MRYQELLFSASVLSAAIALKNCRHPWNMRRARPVFHPRILPQSNLAITGRNRVVDQFDCGGFWLENGPGRAHIRIMADQFRTRLLEVAVKPLKPDRWERRVCEGDMLVMVGYASSRETAQIEGDNALFLLLSTSLK